MPKTYILVAIFYGVDMEAKFHIIREMIDALDAGLVHNPVVDVHFHSQIEIYLVRSGAVEILVNNRKG